MARQYSLPGLPAAPRRALGERLRSYLLGTGPGRVLLVALAVWVLRAAGLPLPGFVAALDTVLLAGFFAVHGFRLTRYLVRRMLWRIRSKLLLSYLFIAVVPVVLLALFFLIAGLLSLTLVASYMVSSQMERTAQQLKVIAHAAAVGLEGEAAPQPAMLSERLAPARTLHPNLAYTYARGGAPLVSRGDAPRQLPAWIAQKREFAGLVH